MRKILKVTLAAVAGVALIIGVGGFLVSPKWTVTRTRVIPAPAERIHAFVGDLATWPAWNAFEQGDPKMSIALGTPSSGEGAVRSWKSEKLGNGSQVLTMCDPAKGVRFDLTIEGFAPFEGWVLYEPADGGTRLTWTDSGDVGSNPLMRWMTLFMDGMLGPELDKTMAALEREVTAKK